VWDCQPLPVFVLAETDVFIWMNWGCLRSSGRHVPLSGRPETAALGKAFSTWLVDGIAWRVPWQRKRFHRDFSGHPRGFARRRRSGGRGRVLAGESTATRQCEPGPSKFRTS